jgi:hypothetical protein
MTNLTQITLYCTFYYYNPLRVTINSVLVIRRSDCINTASGIVFCVKWPSGVQVENCSSFSTCTPVFFLNLHTGRSLNTEYYTRCCINTIWLPDDEHRVARNMYRIIILNVLYNVIVHQVGHLPRVMPGCTVSKAQKKKSVSRLYDRIFVTYTYLLTEGHCGHHD